MSTIAHPRRVIIIEDDKDHNDLLRTLLARQGWDCQQALRGDVAVATLHRERFAYDLVILDLNLPGDSGEYILTVLRNAPQSSNPPVLVITGETHVPAHIRERELVLHKPYDLEDFTRLVDNLTANGAGDAGAQRHYSPPRGRR
jgi:DNA-binding response OmpR family regulator